MIYVPENVNVQYCHFKIKIHNFFSLQGVPFKRNFMSVAKTILKRLFRVYAHIYHQHFDSVMQLQEEAHLNTSFKHFIFFVQVPKKNFLKCRLVLFNLLGKCVCFCCSLSSSGVQPD